MSIMESRHRTGRRMTLIKKNADMGLKQKER